MNIRVSYGEIDTAAATLAAGREEITAKLSAMRSHIGSLVTSGFVTDQASGRFQEAYERYTQSATSVMNELTQIEQFLRDTSRSLQELDQQIAARVQL